MYKTQLAQSPVTPVSTLRAATLFVVASLFALPTANATIAVHDSDIATAEDGTPGYRFSVTGSQLLANPADGTTQVNGALYSASNIDWRREGTTTYYANPWSGATGTITLAWDFSDTTFRPGSMEVYDRFFTVAGASAVTITTSWSGDRSTWTDIRTYTSTGADATSMVTTPGIELTSLTTGILYYRVTFTVASGGTYANSGQGTQWGRSGPDAEAFGITLKAAAIPEPATTATLAGLAVLVMTVLACRQRQHRPR
jgi:hypothetical protein